MKNEDFFKNKPTTDLDSSKIKVIKKAKKKKQNVEECYIEECPLAQFWLRLKQMEAAYETTDNK